AGGRLRRQEEEKGADAEPAGRGDERGGAVHDGRAHEEETGAAGERVRGGAAASVRAQVPVRLRRVRRSVQFPT
ncbi:MAG: hypothetical protein AAF327_16355, partial [Cyanobacteria bacterium P01_A01_bin.37]